MYVHRARTQTTITVSIIVSCCIVLRAVVVSNLEEDLLQSQLVESNKHNLLNIPVAEVGDVLHLEIGLVLKKIVKVVRVTLYYKGCS